MSERKILITRRNLLRAVPGLLLLPAGCAKSPSGGNTSPASGPQLFVTLTVAGNINPNYYYFVLFNVNNAAGPSGTGVTGPIPVVAPPYINGFAAGAFTNYVEYNSGVPGGTGFGYYAIDSSLRQSSYLGSSGYLVTSQAVGSTLSFQLPLADLATAAVTADNILSLQINFVTTNVVPVAGDNLSTPKYFDALYSPSDISGQAGNSYVNIIVRDAGGTVQPNIYQNRDSNIEASGDVAQYVNGIPTLISAAQFADVGDLDITDWSIRLTAP